MRRLSGVFALCSTFFAAILACSVRAQTSNPTYLNATGSPTFSVNIPVPNGFINVANGNLHMEIPLSTLKQRGALALNERLVYDSRIWKIISYSHHYWWPLNIPNAQAGWRFVQGNETGTLNTSVASTTPISCATGPIDPSASDPNPPSNGEMDQSTISWTDPSGTAHVFDGTANYTLQCDGSTTNTITPGYALDGTGYQVKDDGTGNPLVLDPSGNEVYPQVIDRFGNFWSSDANGNLIDDLGRTPVIVTTSGNQTYYDVLSPNGPIQNNGTRVRYTVTTTQVTLNTEFQQQGVTEYQGNNAQPATETAIQSIQFPDGSEYQFGYDSYAQITTVSLPTGGTVQYNWTNYQDSYQNVNRWVSSVVTSDGTTSFTPLVLNQCSSSGTGCKEQVTMQRASGDQTVYTLSLNNGAWNTATTIYSGAASSNVPVSSDSSTFNFANSCSNATVCSVYPGAQYITRSLETTTLLDTNQSTQVQTDYANPQTGQMTDIRQWDYFVGSPSDIPLREAQYTYNGFDLAYEVHLDAAGSIASESSYYYTTTATPTSGVTGHGSANSGGPYLTSVLLGNINGPQPTVSYEYDDTGSVTGITDANGHHTTYTYDPTHTFVTEVDKPDTQYGGVTYHHITRATYDPSSGAALTTDDENSVANGQAYTVHYTYESVAGRPLAVTSPTGSSITFSYPTYNRVDTTLTKDANSSVINSALVDGYGRPSSTVSGGTISTEQTYDGDGRIYSSNNPHSIASATTTDGVTYTYYDALDRPIEVQNPDGTITRANYLGNQVTTTNELGIQTRRTFDVLGELTSVVEPDPSTGQLTMETDYTLDGLGNITCIEQHGGASSSGCSASSSADATSSSRVRRFFYDELSRLKAASIPEHMFLPEHPPAQSCDVAQGSPNVPTIWTDCFYYDANGNRTKRTDNRGVSVQFTFDQLNRVTSETSPTLANTYSYDSGANGVGLLASETSGVQAASFYGYDPLGNLVSQSSCASGACGPTPNGPGYYVISAGYDLSGNITSLTYPDGRQVINTYDSLNRPSTVSGTFSGQNANTPYWTASSYAPPGQLTAALLGNGVSIGANFNGRLNLTSLTYRSQQSQIFSKHYQWANNGANLLGELDDLSSVQRTFSYDKLNRLIAANDTKGTSSTATITIAGSEKITRTCSASGVCTSTYDAGNVGVTVGSMVASTSYQRGSTAASLATALTKSLNSAGSNVVASASGATITLTSLATGAAANYSLAVSSSSTNTPSPDFTLSASGTAMTGGQSQAVPGGLNQQYSLDAWGNLTSMGNSGFTEPANVQNQIIGFTYDAAGRLLADGAGSYSYDDNGLLVALGDGSTYTYDAQGQRIAVGNGTSQSSELFYFGGSLLATLTPGAGTWTDLLYAGASQIADVAGNPNATPVYSVRDQIGSEVASLDNAGNTLTSVNYAPFGQIESGSIADPYFFAGLQRDSSQLDHAQARQYSSATGRWTTPDPSDGSYDPGSPQSMNRYAYVGNMPLTLTDPFGTQAGTINGDPIYNGGGDDCGILCDVVTIGIEALIGGLESLFSGPSFNGSLQPRPGTVSVPGQFGQGYYNSSGTYVLPVGYNIPGVPAGSNVSFNYFMAGVAAGGGGVASTGGGSSSNNPNSNQSCADKLANINRLIDSTRQPDGSGYKGLAQRFRQMNRPGYDDAGHMIQIGIKQAQLRKALDDYTKTCGGPPAAATDYATRPIANSYPKSSISPAVKRGAVVIGGAIVIGGVVILCPECLLAAPVVAPL